jgi:cation-transporting ATPase I
MKAFQIARRVGRLFRKRERRVIAGARRGHVELRNLAAEELLPLCDALETLTQPLQRMEWVQVNGHTQRVVFSYQENAFDADELEALVEHAESLSQVVNAGFQERHRHPSDTEQGAQLLVEFSADVIAAVIGMGLRISPFPSVPFSGNGVALLALVRSTDRLRQGFDSRLGEQRADLVFSLLNSAAQTIAQRPMSSMVDGLHKYSLLREYQTTREVWRRREVELCAESPRPVIGADPSVARPCPLPRGPIEEYAERAWAVSLAGFGLSFITTRSFQRAVAALFGGLPRPARIGREVFAAELTRQLAARGVLVLNAEALRRLDRIDCLVLQGDLVTGDRFVLGGLLTDDPEEAKSARERVTTMFDSEHPLRDQIDGLWVLRPWGKSKASIDVDLEQSSKERLASGALLLSLERADRVVAIAEIEIIARSGIEELILAAHEAQVQVVISSSDDSVVERLHADDVIPVREGLRAGIRRLQREGHTVALVATGDSEGLPLADVGIGLLRDGEPTPWGASLICHGNLQDVQFLMHACRRARQLSKQAVNIALGAASFGALVSAGGLLRLTTRRVVFVVNAASLISMANGFRHSTQLQRLMLPEPRDPTPWHSLDAVGVLARLGTSLEGGLARGEIMRRTPALGIRLTNLEELSEAISDELFNPLAPLLAAGAGLSAVVGSIADASVVAGVVVVNALVGGGQRYRTERKIRELSNVAPPRARVRRSGQEFVVEAADLVQGDLIQLAPGDVVPADCRIIEAHSLEIDASSLTGESLTVRKQAAPSFEAAIADRDSMVYEGTAVASGRAAAVVVATGDATEARRGGSAAKHGRVQGGVERRLRDLMDLTGPVALAAGVGVIGGGLLRGRRLDELVGSAVSLAVASVPEGLPLLATAAQLAAAQRLSKQSALVRNGRSIEALGRVDMICLDKTGTLTEGRIELAFVTDGGEPLELGASDDAFAMILGCSLRASPDPELFPEHDPTDEALYRAATAVGTTIQHDAEGWSLGSELSFESDRSYHAAFGSVGNSYRLCVKGAPEAVLPLCTTWQKGGNTTPLTAELRTTLAARVSTMGQRGLRVLAVAQSRTDEYLGELSPEKMTQQELSFIGFLAFTDPIRPSAVDAIAGLRRAGVKTVMVTGDHPSTAQAVAAKLWLTEDAEMMSGAQLADMDDGALDKVIGNISVFSRTTPAQKVRIVRALQRVGCVVAMIGDGANDAPAIRLADVGVAIGEHSTAAARNAADIILTDGRIETLVTAIAEGRAMWASVRDAVSILLGGNFGEIGFTTAAGLISGRPPLNARQLLLVNLLTDVAPAMAIALRPPTEATLERLALAGPEVTLGKPLTRDIALRAVLTGLGAGGAWTVARLSGGRARATTVALAALVGTQLGQTLRSGQGSRGVLATGLGSAALLAAIIQTPGLSHFFGCRPLGPVGWTTAIGASVAATSLPGISRLVMEWFQKNDRKRSAEVAVAELPQTVS